MKKKWYLIILIFCYSCNNVSSLEEKINTKIERCIDTSCKIEISKITKFNWDRMYVFNFPVSKEIIDSAIGQNYSSYQEFTRPLIFIKNGKIVYSENNPSNVESVINGQIIFDYPDSLIFFTYLPKDAVFKVQEGKIKNGKFYKLYR